MIMNPALPPVFGLIAENISLLVEGIVLGTPKNAAGMRIFGLHEVVHGSIVAAESRRVVVPVDRHRQSICSKRTVVCLDPG